MMLTQKPSSALRPRFQPAHRRIPSAPLLAVQPTKTPGLLAVSKSPSRKKSFTPRKQQHSSHQRHLPDDNKKLAKRAQTQLQHDNSDDNDEPSFPVCDDVSEIGDTPRLPTQPLPPAPAADGAVGIPPAVSSKHRRGKSRLAHIPFPVVSTRTPAAADNAPKTAGVSVESHPIHSAKAKSPAPVTPKKNVARKARKHQRSPSEGIFHLSGASSADESDSDFLLDSFDQLLSSPSVRKDILQHSGPLSSASTPSTPTRPTLSSPVRTARPRPTSTPILPGTSSSAPLPGPVKRHIKFAGSGFQNSPSPDELPDFGRL